MINNSSALLAWHIVAARADAERCVDPLQSRPLPEPIVHLVGGGSGC